MFRHRWLAAFAAAILCASVGKAGSLSVDPVQVVIDDDRRTAALKVINTGAEPTTIRITPFAWSQPDGTDAYDPTPALIASPPIVTIAPGATQTVRIGFRQASASRGSYRIIVEEVPRTGVVGVQVALRLNLPLFARIQPGAVSDLRWSAWRELNGAWVVEAANGGGHFVRVTPPDFTSGSGIRHDETIPPGVVLPNSRRRWVLGHNPRIADAQRWREIGREESGGGRPKVARRGD